MSEPSLPSGVPAPEPVVRRARASLERTPEGVDPWFHRYLGDLLDDRGLRTWGRAKQQFVALAGGVQDKVVVDAGSGFGMVSNLLADRAGTLEVDDARLDARAVHLVRQCLHQTLGTADREPRLHECQPGHGRDRTGPHGRGCRRAGLEG